MVSMISTTDMILPARFLVDRDWIAVFVLHLRNPGNNVRIKS